MQTYKTPQEWIDALQASQRPSGGLSGRLIAWGVARSENQARQVLIAVIVIAIAVALLALRSMSSSTGAASDPEKSAEMAKMRGMIPSMQGQLPR